MRPGKFKIGLQGMACWSLALSVALAVGVLLEAGARDAVAGDAGKPAASGRGAEVFARECAVCHGTGGHGDGPAASLMSPRPRNFQQGLFKLRSTESGELPTDDDLIRTVTRGIPGTGMPSFRSLGASDVRAVVEFVKTLGGPEGEEGSWFELYEVPPAAEVPPMPAPSEAQLTSGKLLYTKMGCAGCHGEAGRGDGKPPEEMKDNWGEPLHARNFHLGIYKGGSRPEDLYLRIMTGLDGTPMTGFWKDAMTAEERWAIVRYLLSFAPPREVMQPSRGSVKLGEGVVPASWEGDAWEADAWGGVDGVSLARMSLEGGWIRSFDPVELRVARSGDELALRLAWNDGPNTCPELRVLFAPADPPATFTLGTEKTPATVWRWTPGEGAAVVTAIGAGKERASEQTLRSRVERHEGRFTVLLAGARPERRRSLRVSILGCAPDGRFRTSTAAQTLE